MAISSRVTNNLQAPDMKGLLSDMRPLPLLVISASALLVMGVVMISSASMDMAAETLGNSYHYVLRQLIFAGLGLLAALVAVNVPVAWWQRSGFLLLMVALILLLLVLTPLGRTVNGSTRWIPMGLFNVQVSEVAKLCLIAYLAGYLVRRHDELMNTWMGFFKPVVVLSFASFLLVIEPDFGATVVLMTAAMGMIFLSGVRLSRFRRGGGNAIAALLHGLVFLLGLAQAAVNMAVNTGLPTKGLTLPLVSYGGSSLIVTCISIGVIVRVELERLDKLRSEAGDKAPGKTRKGGAVYD